MKPKLSIFLGFLLAFEISVTLATAHQHHSEGRLEISAAFFPGDIASYLYVRFAYGFMISIVLLPVAKMCYRALSLWRFAALAGALEIATSVGSAIFREAEPSYAIYFGSFGKYLASRLIIWIPAACFIVLVRRKWDGLRAKVLC